MKFDNKHLFYAGLGVLVLLVVYFSNKKIDLVEVAAPPQQTANFDSSSLPAHLRPPERLPDDAEVPVPARKAMTLNAIGLKPRFDTIFY